MTRGDDAGQRLGTLELLEAARLTERPPRVLLVSSAEVYGTGEGRESTRRHRFARSAPYAASKVAAEFLGLQAHLGRGLEVLRARRRLTTSAPARARPSSSPASRAVSSRAELAGGGEVAVGNLAGGTGLHRRP